MAQTDLSVTRVIQLILAPAVMINATGLLLLTVSNKYSVILNRIRNLTEERRRLQHRSSETDFIPLDRMRVDSIHRQLARLTERARFVRNANVCYFSAIGIFVGVSLLLGLGFTVPHVDLQPYLVLFFLLGMSLDFLGVVYSWFDTFKAYEVVRDEVQSDDRAGPTADQGPAN